MQSSRKDSNVKLGFSHFHTPQLHVVIRHTHLYKVENLLFRLEEKLGHGHWSSTLANRNGPGVIVHNATSSRVCHNDAG